MKTTNDFQYLRDFSEIGIGDVALEYVMPDKPEAVQVWND